MEMTGVYRIALLPDAEERAFTAHMNTVVFKDPAAVQSTRVTRAFDHRLLKIAGPLRQYAWLVDVDLFDGKDYDFSVNVDRIQKRLAAFGVVTGVESFTRVES